MRPIKILHRGFDGLDVSYNAVLLPGALERLHIAKEQASKELRPVRAVIGPGKLDLDVAESGARGGYKYRCDTGPFGEVWFFKDRPRPEAGNIRVSVRSLPLALFGLEGVKTKLAERLRAMGAVVLGESVSRIDFAVDFLMPPNFELSPDRFVSHARAKLREQDYPLTPVRMPGDDFAVVWSKRKASSVTVGKMPGRQVIVYDKRREVVAKAKPYWFRIWSIDPQASDSSVWRVELRAGKQFLTEVAHIKTFADLDAGIRDVMLGMLDTVRHLPRRPHGNVTRCPESALWRAMREQVTEALDHQPPMVTAAELSAVELQRIAERRWKLIESLIPSALAAEGHSAEEAERLVPELLNRCAVRLTRTDRTQFHEKHMRAVERLRFI